MADIKHIMLPNGDTHDIKDATIRDEVQFKIYDSVEDLGLTAGSATIAGAYAALPLYSVLITQSGDFASSDRPSGFYGTILMVKGVNAFRGYIEAKGDTIERGDYRMGVDPSTGVPSGEWIFIGYVVQRANVSAQTSVSAGAWTTVASITLGAGTWELVANVTVEDPRAKTDPVAVCTTRLMAGDTEVEGQPRVSFPISGRLYTSGMVTAKVTLTQSTTIDVQIYPSVVVNVPQRTRGPIWAKRIA